MESNAAKPLQSKPILIILAVGLVAFLLYLFFYVNPVVVAQTLAQTNLAIYAVAFLAYMLNTFFSSMVWYRLLNSLEVKVTRRKAFLYNWVGLFFEATVPQLGWSAEVSKTYMLAKDSKVDAGKIGASVVWQKIFNMTLTVAMLSTGLVLVLSSYQLPLLAAFAIGLVLALSITTLGIVYYVSLKPTATKTLLGWAVKVARFFRKSWNSEGFLSKAEGLLGNFHGGVAQLRAKPTALIVPFVYSVTSFVLEVSVFFLTFAALGQPLRVDAIFIVFTLTGVLQTAGVAFFGFPELIMTVTLNTLGIDASIAVAVALLTRVVNLWFRLIISYVALQWAGIKIMRQNKQQLNENPPA
ncbi:MAG TPA: lysylphosphatidylglycerol synthase transmembrane domain-containing protein [Candidatus Acidoferrales bacterium]|nr:lysylphosphatidylglycerol synthase transmembrane domain-containing protein [Candidatus Acidoferrales bacterium]